MSENELSAEDQEFHQFIEKQSQMEATARLESRLWKKARQLAGLALSSDPAAESELLKRIGRTKPQEIRRLLELTKGLVEKAREQAIHFVAGHDYHPPQNPLADTLNKCSRKKPSYSRTGPFGVKQPQQNELFNMLKSLADIQPIANCVQQEVFDRLTKKQQAQVQKAYHKWAEYLATKMRMRELDEDDDDEGIEMVQTAGGEWVDDDDTDDDYDTDDSDLDN